MMAGSMVVWVKHLSWVWRALIVFGVLIVASGAFLGVQYATALSFGAVSPADGAYVPISDVVVSVSLPDHTPDRDQVEFLVDATPVPAESIDLGRQAVAAKVTLSDGRHQAQVTVTSTNLFSRKIVRSWGFTVDTVKPSVEVVSPDPAEAIATPDSELKVTFSEAVDASFTIDGVDRPLTIDGTSATASLAVKEGEHRLSVLAKDKAGNATTKEWGAYADFTAPTVGVIFWPADPWKAPSARIVVEARDNQMPGIQVTAAVDGAQVPMKAGTTSVPGQQRYSFATGSLTEGTHALEVQVTDRGGHVTKLAQTVLVDSTEQFGARNMSVGARGRDVTALQDILQRKDLLKREPTGVFDQQTTAALLEYKQTRKLGDTPVLDQATFKSLVGALKIDISERKIYFYDEGKLVKTYGVAVGQPRYPTPTGHYRIISKVYHPTWSPPPSPWASGLEPVPPGPDNPLGTRWMGLSAPHVGIHGTPSDWSIGTAASHGCIRMHIPEAEQLFELVYVGTPVDIVP
jgi:L,D-transpeptidase catalytic domain/Putative peptidoglycan binding domain